jgi:methionine-rich copper-binding protein CopC
MALLIVAACSPDLAVAPYLVASWPVQNALMSVAPHSIDLTFNQALQPDATGAEVRSAEGDVVLRSRATLDPSDPRHLQVRIFDATLGAFDVRWRAVAADSRMPSVGVLRLTFEDGTPSPPRIDVSPHTAESGERLELVGKGFAHSSAVTLAIGDDAQALATTQTDAAGKFNLEARVPASVPLGMQPVVATDAEGRRAVGSVEVHWGGWPPVVAYVVGQPGPDPGEVTFTLTARNLSDYVLEHMRVLLQDPRAGVLVSADPSAQRHDGSLEWDIAVVSRGEFGPYHATYRTSDAVVGHAWLEYRHRAERGCTAGRDCLPAFISSSTADSTRVQPAL